MSCQRVRSQSDHGRSAAIILSMLPLIASHEKTEREGAPYKIFIYMHGSRDMIRAEVTQTTPYINRDQRPALPPHRGSRAPSNAPCVQRLEPPQALRAKRKRVRPSPSLLLPPRAAGHMRGPAGRNRSRAARLAAVAACRQRPVEQACQGDQQASCISWHARGHGSGAGEGARWRAERLRGRRGHQGAETGS